MKKFRFAITLLLAVALAAGALAETVILPVQRAGSVVSVVVTMG